MIVIVKMKSGILLMELLMKILKKKAASYIYYYSNRCNINEMESTVRQASFQYGGHDPIVQRMCQFSSIYFQTHLSESRCFLQLLHGQHAPRLQHANKTYKLTLSLLLELMDAAYS